MIDPYTYQEDSRISNPDALRSFGGSLRGFGKNLDHVGAVVNTFIGGITLGLAGGIPKILGAFTTFTGNTIQAIDSLLKGQGARAGKELARGAVEAGVMAGTVGALGWAADTMSVMYDGKYLSTRAGELFGALADGMDKPRHSHVAAPVMLPGVMPHMATTSQPPAMAPDKWVGNIAAERGMSAEQLHAMQGRSADMQEHMAELESAYGAGR